jgi:hypothetical protein
MKKNYTPRGVTYEWTKDRVEYQLFPEEFFSGSDVKLYFGDVFIDEVITMQFVLQENVRPLFGYSSYTHEEVSRGRRMVQGNFAIAFKEAGFLSSVLDHIGQFGDLDKTQNEIVDLMTGGQRQTWHAEAKQSFEKMMAELPEVNDASIANKKYTAYENTIWGRKQDNSVLGLDKKPYFYTSRQGTDHQKILRNGGFDIFITYGPLEETIETVDSKKTIQDVSFNNTVKAIRGVELTSTGQQIVVDGTILEVYSFIARDID